MNPVVRSSPLPLVLVVSLPLAAMACGSRPGADPAGAGSASKQAESEVPDRSGMVARSDGEVDEALPLGTPVVIE